MNLDVIIQNLIKGFDDIAGSFTKDISILWLIAPVVLFWAVLEIYFGRHKKEELGWNTALGNGLSTFWVSIICMRFLFEEQFKNFEISKFIIVASIFFYGFIVVFNSFSHKLKKKIVFLLASPTPIYFFSLVTILWTYGLLPINKWIIIDLIILYVVIGVTETGLKKLIKEKPPEEDDLSLKENELSLKEGGLSKEPIEPLEPLEKL